MLSLLPLLCFAAAALSRISAHGFSAPRGGPQASATRAAPAAGLQISCGLDPKINAWTFESYLDEIGNIFGSACGRNRGIFVTDPPDGHTYNCAHFPVAWNVTDANAVKQAEPAHAVEVLDKFIKSVYVSTPEYVRQRDSSSCDFEAMSAFTCGKEAPFSSAPWAARLDYQPIRAVNLMGVFIVKPWVSPSLVSWGAETGVVDHRSFCEKCQALGVCGKLQSLASDWYTAADFEAMKTAGLNAVRVPVGQWFFSELSKVAFKPYLVPSQGLLSEDHPLTRVLAMAKAAGLQAIIDVSTEGLSRGAKNDVAEVAGAAAKYIRHIATTFGLDNVLLLELTAEAEGVVFDAELVKAVMGKVKSVAPELPVMLPESSSLPPSLLSSPAPAVFVDTVVYHSFDVADIASDTAAADREKQYAHEKIACGYKAPLHFTTCTKAPTFVGELSLAIDNCLPLVDKDFKDFGQCDRLASRHSSPWWQRHSRSFAMRQLGTYERELGWAFAAYKLDSQAMAHPSAAYWSFEEAVAQGLIDLSSTEDACAHYPAADYILGDDTVAPSPQPSWWVPPQYLPSATGGADGDGDGDGDTAPAPVPAAEGPSSARSSVSATSTHLVLSVVALVAIAAGAAVFARQRLGSGQYEIIPGGSVSMSTHAPLSSSSSSSSSSPQHGSQHA